MLKKQDVLIANRHTEGEKEQRITKEKGKSHLPAASSCGYRCVPKKAPICMQLFSWGIFSLREAVLHQRARPNQSLQRADMLVLERPTGMSTRTCFQGWRYFFLEFSQDSFGGFLFGRDQARQLDGGQGRRCLFASFPGSRGKRLLGVQDG